MELAPRLRPVFGIFSGTNHDESQLYIDGVLSASSMAYMARLIDLVLARKSSNPFSKIENKGVVAFFPCALVRDSERGRRVMVESIWDAHCHPVFELPPFDLSLERRSSLELIALAKANDGEGVARELLDGADPDSVDESGNSALLHATAKGNDEIISQLLAYGANPFCVNDHDMSAFSLAQDRSPRFVPLLKKAEKQMPLWEWIRSAYAKAEPW